MYSGALFLHLHQEFYMGRKKIALSQNQQLEMTRMAWVNLCHQYDIMGQQLKEFALLLAGVLEDAQTDTTTNTDKDVSKLSNVSKDPKDAVST